MTSEILNPFPRPRTLVHPGRFNPVRIQSMHSTRGRHFRLTLMPGKSLFDALVQPLANVGVKNASTTILGGWFEELQYCVAPPDPSGQAVVAYAAPVRAGHSYMVFGNATLGKSMQRQPLVHCHGTIRTETGAVKGGHILSEFCIVGSEPISALVTTFDGFELNQAFDPETNIPLLQPYKESTNE